MEEILLDRVRPRHYILANSDSCPPGVSVEKFRLVTQIVQARYEGSKIRKY